MPPTVSGPQSLVIRKLADKQPGEHRVHRFDSETGERHLVNPKTGEREPWPLLGIQIEGEPPATCKVSTAFVKDGVAEGWLQLEGEQFVHRPGGPDHDRFAVTHTFRHADSIVFKTVDGDVRYRVAHQPDKYADPGDDDTPVTDEHYAAGQTRVDHFYELELEA